MKRSQAITATIAALALIGTLVAGAAPAQAATAGYHAAYFSETDFLTLSPGASGQFAVGYLNSGDRTWAKGTTTQANLATAAPLDNTRDFSAGWSVAWASANRYATQNAAVVSPGQVGFFIYNVIVPASAPGGEHRFYGRPVIDGLTFLEDYGYYQSVTVINAAVLPSPTPAPTLPPGTPAPTPSGGFVFPTLFVTILSASNGSVDITVNPGATCSGYALYPDAVTRVPLASKVAPASGLLSWTFTPSPPSSNSGLVHIDCILGAESASAEAKFLAP
ncbi:MAG: hypothetical protein NVS1B1_10080 [Candidatus Limnocylindrales bacterium]